MNRRKVLIVGTFLTIIFGFVAISKVFIGSMKSSARAEAALPRYNIEKLEIGKLSILKGPEIRYEFNGYKFKLLAYKNSLDDLKVWYVPVKNGLVALPGIHWWRPYYSCKQLSIVENNGESEITCLDSEISEWWRNEWRWSLDGSNTGTMVDDLERAKGVIEGKYFVYGKNS